MASGPDPAALSAARVSDSFDLIDAVAAMDVPAEPAISGKVVLRLSDD